MEQKIDVIICVGVKDVFIVKKTVHYVKKHISPTVIYLITNHRFFRFFNRKFQESNDVVLIDESLLVPGVNIEFVRNIVNQHFNYHFRAGWYFQQFLKMGFSESTYAHDYYLIWDADTIPTSPMSFFDDSGKMLMTLKEEYNEPYFTTMNRLIGLGKQVGKSFIAEHMLIKTAYMQELIKEIECAEITGNTWIEKVINATPVNQGLSFSEFETYGSWVYRYHPESISLRNFHTMRHAGRLFGRSIRNYEIDEFYGVTDTISLEVGDFPHGYRKWKQYLQLFFLRLLRP